jgi:aminopeptidase N
MKVTDPLVHPALLDPRQWGDVDLYEAVPALEREPVAGEERHAPDSRFKVTHLKLNLRFDAERQSVAGTAALTLVPFADGLRQVELDAAEMDVTAVRLLRQHDAHAILIPVGGEAVALQFEVHKEKLTVELNQAAARGEELTVEIAYSCRPRKGLFFVQPDHAYPEKPRQIWSQGETEDAHWWFPCADVPHQKMTSELIATVADNFFALSNGTLAATSENPLERTKTYHWRQDQPHPAYLVTVVIGEYKLIQERLDGLPVNYYVYADKEEAGRRLFQNTPEMVEFFAGKFGYPYPYPKYAQILVEDFLFGAMENTSATTMTDRVLLDERAALDLSYDDIVAHELAHQWWGDLVTCKHWSQIWLNESFATYSEYLWREFKQGADEARFTLHQDWLTYLREDALSHRRPIVYHRYRFSDELMDRHAYEKGACVLHMLRHVLGDDAFFRSLARYLGKFAFGVAEANDFKVAIEEATGKNLHWFFEQWIYKAGYPELEVEYEWQRERKTLRLAVKQVQEREGKAEDGSDAVPVFRFPVEVEIVTADAESVIETEHRTSYQVTVEREEQEFYFPCESKPRMVVFDKGHRVFKLMRFPKSLQELKYQLAHDTDVLGRVRAARELREYKGEDGVSALGAVVKGQDFWAVRMAAAITLGEIGGEQARGALTNAYRTSEDPRVRRGAVWALGRVAKETREEGVIDLLGDAVNDASYFVGVAAIRALAHVGGDRAYDILNSALARGSWQEVLRAAVFHGFAQAKEKRAVDLALKHCRYGEPVPVRLAAIAALGALGKEMRKDKADDRVLDRLVELLKDKSIRARVASVRALGKIGNPRALQPLHEAERRECLDQLRAAVQDAIAALEKKD